VRDVLSVPSIPHLQEDPDWPGRGTKNVGYYIGMCVVCQWLELAVIINELDSFMSLFSLFLISIF
jgi:hypothetical protein